MSFTPKAGQVVKVRDTVAYHAGLIGTVAHVRPGNGTRPTLIAVDVEPDRQLDFFPAELEVIGIRTVGAERESEETTNRKGRGAMSAHSGGFWECEECGYSKWHYASEFADGASGDMRRICADCGHLHGATSEERESAPLHRGAAMHFERFQYEQRSSDGYKTGILTVSFARPVSLEHATAYLEESASKGNSTVLWVRPERAQTMYWERQESAESEERVTREHGESLADFRRRQDAATDYTAPESAKSHDPGVSSAPELINGCNVEACLRYARERIAALEDERDALRAELNGAGERIPATSAQFVVPTKDMAASAGIGRVIGWRYLKSYPAPGRWEPNGFQFVGTNGILETDLDGMPTRVSALYAFSGETDDVSTQDRIADLESERDALQAKVSSALAAIERWMALGHAPAVTADLRARLETDESARERVAERDALRRAIHEAWDALDRDDVPAAYDALESAEGQS
jgi:hypothetical protein